MSILNYRSLTIFLFTFCIIQFGITELNAVSKLPSFLEKVRLPDSRIISLDGPTLKNPVNLTIVNRNPRVPDRRMLVPDDVGPGEYGVAAFELLDPNLPVMEMPTTPIASEVLGTVYVYRWFKNERVAPVRGKVPKGKNLLVVSYVGVTSSERIALVKKIINIQSDMTVTFDW